tara:strand:+ start:1920 stop:2507 length:588 start_codon:yes stop_codon:yes gene_type:complete
MTTTFLISEAKIRNFTSLNDSVDSALIKNSIRTAQDIGLQNILGTVLYQKLLSDVDSGSLANQYKTLVDDYVQDYLLYAVYFDTIEEIYIRPRNNGLLRPNGGENSDIVERDLYEARKQSIRNKMEFYAQRLTEYILEEDSLFPELQQDTKLYQQIPDYSNKYKNPFVMKGGYFLDMAREYGIRTYDRRYRQYPQ